MDSSFHPSPKRTATPEMRTMRRIRPLISATDSMIGFKPQPRRVPVRNEQGHKLGYLAAKDGQQLFQNEHGETVAVIKKFKQFPIGRVGAQGGTIMPSDNY